MPSEVEASLLEEYEEVKGMIRKDTEIFGMKWKI
jgi:hypothetical protein